MKHPLAVVHEDAKIGENVTISQFATVEADVEIGNNCWIGPNAVIMSGTRMGHDCKVFPGAVVGGVPQDLKYKGEPTYLEIGNHVIIREYCTLNLGTTANGKTVVGNHCLLMAYVHIAHDCIIGDNCILANNTNLAGHVELDEFVVVGGMSAVQQFVKIGKHVMLGGGSLVNKDVPPYVRAARHPISYIGINSIGLKRRGYTNDHITLLQQIYKKIFVDGQNMSRAIEAVREVFPETTLREDILTFIENSEIGVIKGFK